MKKNCDTCVRGFRTSPCQCTEYEKWEEHALIKLGRREGIEQAAKVCYEAGKLAHLGFVAEVCGERVEALLKGL